MRGVDVARVALVFATGMLAGAHVGKLPVALPLLADAFGLSLVQAGLAISMLQFTSMAIGIVGGMLADRFGQRRVMGVGLLLLALGGLVGARSDGIGLLLASRAIESVGFVATVLPGPALLARLVPPARMRPVMGLWACYMPAGMGLALLVSPWLLQAVGWRGTWQWLAGLSLLLALLIPALIDADPPVREPPRSLSLVRRTVARPGPWLLALSFGCYAGQWMGLFGFLPTFYAQQGIAGATAGSMTAIGVLVNTTGNFGAGLLMQRGVAAHRLLAFAAVTMLACAWVLFGSGLPSGWRYGAVLVFSAVGGLIPGTLFALTLHVAPDPQSVSTTTGLMQQGSAFGQFVTPPAIGAIVSASGDWSLAWTVTGVLALGNLGAAFLVRGQRTAPPPGPVPRT